MNTLIKNISIKNILSFGPHGIDLPIEPLNILVGNSGTGKSNFIKALALLHAAPTDISSPIRYIGGISEFLHTQQNANYTPVEASIDVVIDTKPSPIRHLIKFTEQDYRFHITKERIDNTSESHTNLYYQNLPNEPISILNHTNKMVITPSNISPQQSILSQRTSPDHFPELYNLSILYKSMRLYRNWDFGPFTKIHTPPSADLPSTFLTERGENLALILSSLRGEYRQAFIDSLKNLHNNIVDFKIELKAGQVQLLIIEQSNTTRYIPVSHISDSTLRYMTVVLLLLHPTPPPLIVIEEPALGIHPSTAYHIGELLLQASKKTQIIVTTNSPSLLKALQYNASTTILCSKVNGESDFHRIEPKHLSKNWQKTLWQIS